MQDEQLEKYRVVLEALEKEAGKIAAEAQAIRTEASNTLPALEELVSEMSSTKAEELEGRMGRVRTDEETLLQAHKILTDEMSERAQQYRHATTEGEKLFFEVFKLIATLSTGSIAAMTAITAIVVPNPSNLSLFWIGCSLVLSSIGLSISAAWTQAIRMIRRLSPASFGRSVVNPLYWLFVCGAVGGLVGGIAVFSIWISSQL